MVVILDGDATQVPSETVRTCPLSLVPETVGLAVTTGALVMIAVEAVNWVEVPIELVATTRARAYLPMLWMPEKRLEDCNVSTGDRLDWFPPLPNSPLVPNPQQRTTPVSRIEHVDPIPAETEVALETPIT